MGEGSIGKEMMKFKTIEDAKGELIRIYNSVMRAVDPYPLVKDAIAFEGNALRVFDLSFPCEKVYVIGFGKASCPMAKGVLDVVPSSVVDGVVVTKYHHTKGFSGLKVIEASHPIPDENSVKGATEVLRCLQKAGEKDVVLFLISGGGSSLLELPRGIKLAHIQKVTDFLLRSGATIGEINIVRKHLSLVKGGNLAKASYPAPFVSLVVSDVLGSDLSSIASGPTVPDPSTFYDCYSILVKYNLWDKVPKDVVNLIERGMRGEEEDTPKIENPVFKKGHSFILADNKVVCKKVVEEARACGIKAIYVDSPLTSGKVEDFIDALGELMEKYLVDPPSMLVMGGEVTLSIPDGKGGLGGRNQHMALLYAKRWAEKFPHVVSLFASTDGTDGPTDACGGFSNVDLLKKGGGLKALDEALENYDSYHFLKKAGEIFVTGPTGNNLNDVFMFYAYK